MQTFSYSEEVKEGGDFAPPLCVKPLEGTGIFREDGAHVFFCIFGATYPSKEARLLSRATAESSYRARRFLCQERRLSNVLSR
jgi:hypothetical protein